MRAWRAGLLLAWGVLGVGCATQSGMGRARVLPEGESELFGIAQASVLSARLTPGEPVPLPWIQVGAGWHRGYGGGLELGARLWGGSFLSLSTLGIALDAKLQLVQSPEPTRGVDVATGLSLAYHVGDLGGWPWNGPTATVPLLVGFNLGRLHLVLGPRGGVTWVTGQGQAPLLLGFGGLSLGMEMRLHRQFSLMPELVLLYSPVSFDGTRVDAPQRGASLAELGLGVSYRW